MNPTNQQRGLPLLLRLVSLVALALCPSLPARPGPPEKPDADERKAEQPHEAKEPEARFALHGGFAHGVLLRRQEEVQQLALLIPHDPGTTPEDYQASIDWGDNSGVTRGRLNPLTQGFYEITGRHVYAATGTYKVKIAVNGLDGTTAEVQSRIEVGDLYAGSLDDYTVASLPVGDAASSLGDWQATLDWGDGSSASAGCVRRDGALLLVGGSHAYAHNGPYTISVLATEGATVRLARKREVHVVPPKLTMKVSHQVRSNPGEGCMNVEVAVFRVPNPLATVRDFSALINWGDGTPLDTAVLVGSGGVFRVLGSHTYDQPGAYTIRTLLMRSWH